MRFEPIGDQVIVRRDMEAATTAGGIAKTEASRNFKMYGTVIAVGPGAFRAVAKQSSVQPLLSNSNANVNDFPDSDRLPMQIKIGDVVLVPPNMTMIPADLDHPDPANVLFIGREPMILAIVHPE